MIACCARSYDGNRFFGRSERSSRWRGIRIGCGGDDRVLRTLLRRQPDSWQERAKLAMARHSDRLQR
jgi:hypothetical protein